MTEEQRIFEGKLFASEVDELVARKLKAHRLSQEFSNLYGEDAQARQEILEKLEGEEKRLIVFRYFQDMTQTEVAKKMGMSQVQISRMEKRILKKLREMEK